MPAPCFDLKSLYGFKKMWGGWWKGRLNGKEEEGKYPLYPNPRELEVPSNSNPVQFT